MFKIFVLFLINSELNNKKICNTQVIVFNNFSTNNGAFDIMVS